MHRSTGSAPGSSPAPDPSSALTRPAAPVLDVRGLRVAARGGDIVRGVEAIAHVDVLRIHTRVPLVDPARIDADILAALETSKALFVVLQDRKSTRLNSSHSQQSRMPSSA